MDRPVESVLHEPLEWINTAVFQMIARNFVLDASVFGAPDSYASAARESPVRAIQWSKRSCERYHRPGFGPAQIAFYQGL